MTSLSSSSVFSNGRGEGSGSVVYTPLRTASPFQPPPLTPLTLRVSGHGHPNQQLLTRALAEEIRLLVPARLQLVDTWQLAYSLERDGASLATLYETCKQFSHRSPRAGYVLVIRDSGLFAASSVFGAYMTDPPHPSSHYYGTGECFLWRASVLPLPGSLAFGGLGLELGPGSEPGLGRRSHITEEMLELAGLPPPPSADTTRIGRSTTLRGDPRPRANEDPPKQLIEIDSENGLVPPAITKIKQSNRSGIDSARTSGTTTPERIRFKAFPYSGVNDYMIFCETGFLSLGGGDGHYGLWLDSSLEKGVSASSLTFGNEPLSDEGTKFDILGVEVWYVGA